MLASNKYFFLYVFMCLSLFSPFLQEATNIPLTPTVGHPDLFLRVCGDARVPTHTSPGRPQIWKPFNLIFSAVLIPYLPCCNSVNPYTSTDTSEFPNGCQYRLQAERRRTGKRRWMCRVREVIYIQVYAKCKAWDIQGNTLDGQILSRPGVHSVQLNSVESLFQRPLNNHRTIVYGVLNIFLRFRMTTPILIRPHVATPIKWEKSQPQKPFFWKCVSVTAWPSLFQKFGQHRSTQSRV